MENHGDKYIRLPPQEEEEEIKIAHKISEESFKTEASPLEHAEMLEAIEDGPRMVLGGILLSLNLNEELVQVIKGHGAIL
ncbi:hypothetical protein CJ030_MR0G003723 [Morella rubra]|uniref:Uncharacterized protein n=1 Tax=Morella rubra TaxID=262757 RepID=A0A6A1UMM3_9ROSI|nr:hypothetical protein CJ030_MR0G003723 [Morella rubra]